MSSPLSPAHAHEEKYGWLARLPCKGLRRNCQLIADKSLYFQYVVGSDVSYQMEYLKKL